MTNANKSIEKSLFDRVMSMVLSVNLPVKYPNVKFDKPSDKKYLEIIHFPNSAIEPSWDNENVTNRGILQINVHWTPNLGSISISNITDEITNNYFPRGKIFDGLMINANPAIGTLVENNDETFVPVRISYIETQIGDN